MGGYMGTYGEVSPITHHSYGGEQCTVQMEDASMGGTAPGHSAFDIQLIRSSSTPTPIPPPQLDTSSSLATSVVSILKDSSSDPRVEVFPFLVIKDKRSNLGLKEITNKES
jgi:hypothetical protein